MVAAIQMDVVIANIFLAGRDSDRSGASCVKSRVAVVVVIPLFLAVYYSLVKTRPLGGILLTLKSQVKNIMTFSAPIRIRCNPRKATPAPIQPTSLCFSTR